MRALTNMSEGRHLVESGRRTCREPGILSVLCNREVLHRTYPAVVVLVKKTNKSASTEFELIVHGRLEVKLYTVNVDRRSGRCRVR